VEVGCKGDAGKLALEVGGVAGAVLGMTMECWQSRCYRDEMLAELEAKGFECSFVCHASAILERDFPSAIDDISSILSSFDVPITEIVGTGGGETKGTQRMRKAFANALADDLIDSTR